MLDTLLPASIRSPLLIAGTLLLAGSCGTALSAEPAAAAPATSAADAPAAEPAAASPVFLGILKEGEKLPTASQIYAEKKAQRDKAELHDALMAS